MSSWAPTKYKTKNWSSYNDSLKQRGSLSIWFDPAMAWVLPPSGKRGRQQSFSDAAIQTCLTLKVLFGLPLRQTTGFAQSLLGLVGLDWAVPDFSTLCRRQKTLNVSLPYRGGTGPLNLLIDSTGIKVEGEGEWNARKHGGPKRRIWRKIHITIDEETLEIRAVEVTRSSIGDAPMLPTYSIRSRWTKRLAVSPGMGLMTPTNATTRAQSAMPMPSFHHARMRRYGSLTRPEPGRGTEQFDLQSTSVAHCGGR